MKSSLVLGFWLIPKYPDVFKVIQKLDIFNEIKFYVWKWSILNLNSDCQIVYVILFCLKTGFIVPIYFYNLIWLSPK